MERSINSKQQNIIQLNQHNISNVIKDLPRRANFMMSKLVMLQFGTLEVTLPDGKTFRYEAPEPGPEGKVVLNNWKIVRRAIWSGSMGVAESYIDGDWDSPDVTTFLEFFVQNAYGGGAESFFKRNRLLNFFHRIAHMKNRNSKSGSKRNISAHYDLGNKFYGKWLDPSMTYSSAIFQDGANSLEEAQQAKYRSLARRMDIKPHHHILEIGCGWGGFAEYVAGQIGASVTCLTISKEQFDFATKRISDAGLDDKVTIKFQDYRDEKGVYDRIGSIEMFEAVGEAYWPSYFAQLRDRLKPDGQAGLQIITIRDEDFPHYRTTPDFIQRYIFPGGMLPSAEILKELGKEHSLKQISSRAFGYDYALTLEAWRKSFWEKWPEIKPLGFDERFKRIWEFYFQYCEAGFRANSINVRQIVFAKS